MDFDKICTIFTMQEPFYGILLSSVERVPVPASVCPTIGVTRNNNVFRMRYNPEFISQLDIPTTLEVLKHEMCHLAFNHFNIWENEPENQNEQRIRNVAADIEVNSYINKNNVHGINYEYAAKYGWDEQEGTREYFKRLVDLADKQNQQTQQASKNVSKPCNGGKSSNPQDNTENENEETKDTQEQDNQQQQSSGGNENRPEEPDNSENSLGGTGGGISGSKMENETFTDSFVEKFSSFDDHSQWPTDKESVEICSQMVEDMVISAAEEVTKSCGKLPAEMKGRVDDIVKKRKPKPVADWKRYVRRYLGNEFSEFIRKSKKRESRRFPDAAGNRHRRKSNILVGIDTSGSVSMPEYIEFFGQIRTLTQTATFDVIECDAAIQHKYTFNGRPNLEIHGGGGTAFEPVVDYFIENKKKYDALIYFTDGECSVPKNTPKETLWVISSHGDKNRRKDFIVNGSSVVFIPKKNNK